MQVKNLMSEDLITVDKDQSLSDALKLLRKHNVSRLPVTNNKELVGIISERDIANKLGSSKYESMPASRLHISSVMVKDVFTVPETMQLDEVAKLMLENGIGSVPVMNDDGKMVGIVSKADFVTLAVGIPFDKITGNLKFILRRRNQFIFCRRDCCKNTLFTNLLRIYHQTLTNILHNGLLIVRIINGKVGIVAKDINVTT